MEMEKENVRVSAKTVKVIGMGMSPEDLTLRARSLINEADVLIGGKRHLAIFQHLPARKIPIDKKVHDVAPVIKELLARKQKVVVIASGDPGYFGIARLLVKELGKEKVEIIPNITTFQAAFARVKENWDDALLLSLHGRPLPRLAPFVRKHRKIGILTDQHNTPAAVASALLTEDPLLAATRVFIAERLGSPQEKVHRYRLQEIPRLRVASPNVMILMSPEGQAGSAPADTIRLGIPDRLFSHRRGLITKDEVRIFVLAKLNLPREGIVWDVGSGSGSIAVEAALLAPELTVFAVEKNGRRMRDIKLNREKFRVDTAVTPILGEAPRVLRGLPRPHRIFVGGTEGKLLPVLRSCSKALLPNGKIVVNAATLETVNSALAFFEKHGWSAEVTLLTISTMKKVGSQKRFQALNPVFVIEASNPGKKTDTRRATGAAGDEP